MSDFDDKGLGRIQAGVVSALADGMFHSADEIAEALETCKGSVFSAVHGLRRRRYPILMSRGKGYIRAGGKSLTLDDYHKHSKVALADIKGGALRARLIEPFYREKYRQLKAKGINVKHLSPHKLMLADMYGAAIGVYLKELDDIPLIEDK